MLSLVIALIRTVAATAFIGWIGRFAARLVARQLQMPEALVRDAGCYIYARVDLFERALFSGLFGKV
jgi:hypothetical protein